MSASHDCRGAIIELRAIKASIARGVPFMVAVESTDPRIKELLVQAIPDSVPKATRSLLWYASQRGHSRQTLANWIERAIKRQRSRLDTALEQERIAKCQ